MLYVNDCALEVLNVTHDKRDVYLDVLYGDVVRGAAELRQKLELETYDLEVVFHIFNRKMVRNLERCGISEKSSVMDYWKDSNRNRRLIFPYHSTKYCARCCRLKRHLHPWRDSSVIWDALNLRSVNLCCSETRICWIWSRRSWEEYVILVADRSIIFTILSRTTFVYSLKTSHKSSRTRNVTVEP